METQFELDPTKNNQEELSNAEVEMKRYRGKEEDFSKQKAGMKWFNDGDRNTRFFHKYVKGRHKRLAIHERTEAIFEKQFTEAGQIEDKCIIEVIPKLITADQNQ